MFCFSFFWYHHFCSRKYTHSFSVVSSPTNNFIATNHSHSHTHSLTQNTFSPTSIILYCANYFCRRCYFCCYSFQFPQLQSLIWIAMSVMAILAYFCIFNFRGMIASLGTVTELTLFRMYFHGRLLTLPFDYIISHRFLWYYSSASRDESWADQSWNIYDFVLLSKMHLLL